MLRPTISNEKYGKRDWYTQITVPQSRDILPTGTGRIPTGQFPINKATLAAIPPGYGLTCDQGGPKYLSLPSIKGRVLKIDNSRYTPLHPQSISLEDCEGDGSTVEFAACVTLPFDGLLKKYKFEESELIPLYHVHVLWSYAARLTRVEDDKFKLTYTSKGAHLSGLNQGNEKNVPRGLVAPPITSSYLAIRSKDGKFTCGPFTKEELLKSAVDGKLTVRVRLSVPRDYFSLEKIIDLSKKPIVTKANRKLMEMILRGDEETKEVVPQWERDICHRALALNPRYPTPTSVTNLLVLLRVIWGAPIGWFPVAKRVAIGVLADMVHLNARSSVFDFVQTTILPHIPESGLATVHLPSVLGSMMMHLNAVSRVRKTTVDLSSGDFGHPADLEATVLGPPVVADDDEAEDEESSSESSSGDQRSSGDEDAHSNRETEKEDTVEQEDTVEVAAREDWYDAESGGVENPDENA